MTENQPPDFHEHSFAVPASSTMFDAVTSPQLVVEVAGVQSNVDRMIQMVGGASKVAHLRPHLKTHKSEAVTRWQLERGIRHFKASTIGEVAMAASVGAESVLLAHQPVGPKVQQIVDLSGAFANCCVSVLVDDEQVLRSLARIAKQREVVTEVFVDVDCGMHRTGVRVGDHLDRLIEAIQSNDSLKWTGLHVYDGHLHAPQLDRRRDGVHGIVDEISQTITKHRPHTVIVGGTPTFGLWIEQSIRSNLSVNWQFSPGTCTLWDWGYADAFPDLSFNIAAAVLTRVISQPDGGDDESRQLVCFDLGYKAIASEMPAEDRLMIVGLPDLRIIGHSEEHLVVSVPKETHVTLGQAFWALPRHICPTVARYDHAAMVSPTSQLVTSTPIEGRNATGFFNSSSPMESPNA